MTTHKVIRDADGNLWRLTYKVGNSATALNDHQWTVLAEPTKDAIKAAGSANRVILNAAGITYIKPDNTRQIVSISDSDPKYQACFTRLSQCLNDVHGPCNNVAVPHGLFEEPDVSLPKRETNRPKDVDLIKLVEGVECFDIGRDESSENVQKIVFKEDGEGKITVTEKVLRGEEKIHFDHCVFLVQKSDGTVAAYRHTEIRKKFFANNYALRVNDDEVVDAEENGKETEAGKKFRTENQDRDTSWLIDMGSSNRSQVMALAYAKMRKEKKCCKKEGDFHRFMEQRAQLLCNQGAEYMIAHAEELVEKSEFMDHLAKGWKKAWEEGNGFVRGLFPKTAVQIIEDFCTNPANDHPSAKLLIELYAHYIKQPKAHVGTPLFYALAHDDAAPLSIAIIEKDAGKLCFQQGGLFTQSSLDPDQTYFIYANGKGILQEKCNEKEHNSLKKLCVKSNMGEELVPVDMFEEDIDLEVDRQEREAQLTELYDHPNLHIGSLHFPFPNNPLLRKIRERHPRARAALDTLAGGAGNVCAYLAERKKSGATITQILSEVQAILETTKEDGTPEGERAFRVFSRLNDFTHSRVVQRYIERLNRRDLTNLKQELGINVRDTTNDDIARALYANRNRFSQIVADLKAQRESPAATSEVLRRSRPNGVPRPDAPLGDISEEPSVSVQL